MADAVAYVLYDEEEITALICAGCLDEDVDNGVPITEPGVIICDRCGKTAS